MLSSRTWPSYDSLLGGARLDAWRDPYNPQHTREVWGRTHASMCDVTGRSNQYAARQIYDNPMESRRRYPSIEEQSWIAYHGLQGMSHRRY